MPDNLTPEQRSRCMSHIKGKDTLIERRLRSCLQKNGYRFRKNYSGLPGKPDVVFTRVRVAVFVDGDFWHGYKFSEWKSSLSDFWKTKIIRNQKRDHENTEELKAQGWIVIRLWQHSITKHMDKCVELIIKTLEWRKNAIIDRSSRIKYDSV